MTEPTQGDTEVGTGASEELETEGQQPAENSTEETSASEQKSEGSDAESKTEEGGDDAPVDYGEFDYSEYPEGFELDEKSAEKFVEIGKQYNLPKDAMQEFIRLDAERSKQMQESIKEQFETTVKEWRSEIEADKEFGGTHLDETMQAAAKALDTFGKDLGLREFLDESGLGNHPALVKVFARIGKAISEDSILTGKEPQSGKKSPAEILYGNTQ